MRKTYESTLSVVERMVAYWAGAMTLVAIVTLTAGIARAVSTTL